RGMLLQTYSIGAISASNALNAADSLRDFKIMKAYRGGISRLIFNWISSLRANDAVMNYVSKGSPIGIGIPREHSMVDTPLNRIVTTMRRQGREFRQRGSNYKIQ
ncbi:MAG: hypothetical protein AAF569_09550, partial [Pseudomonadota bacterium]